ncbi:DUF262 domain-containing protein [Cellulomonas sp.]|uniref:DUF262 domain-containing protein n=1 Tax=Cellulomonas sp. TaxID=40001 RepID=UPI001B02B0EB|nr:DUF262 domain-containing protein [Cellulomonas sp.]MBO9555543.1 DUF262 domain-containing protein [Cellulomonas sp.]
MSHDGDELVVLEETFAGQGVGVEAEPDELEAGIKPWDPEKIRVSTKSFSLRNVLDMIDSKDLELAPDFQRNRVWKARQKSRLIESLLLQIPLPAFYFAEDVDGMLRVVDGLQRLSTIHSYVREQNLALEDLEYLHTSEGQIFDELSPALQRRLNNAQIVVHVIDPTTPDEVKYDIFKRINTGGEPLNGMEIRHCMSRPRSRAFLRRCVQSDQFQRATNGTLRDHVRMHDREAALRFIAFRLLGNVDRYEDFGSLERLLDWAAAQLDDPKLVADNVLDQLFTGFEQAMFNAELLFGAHAFRKWSTWNERLSPINRALLESWGYALAEANPAALAVAREEIVSEARKAMTQDYRYIESISSSTSDARRVRERFAKPQAILKGALE